MTRPTRILPILLIAACARPAAPAPAGLSPCTSDTMTCAGQVRQVCRRQDDGGFDDFRQTCAPPQTCSQGWCINPAPCTPGARACGGGFPMKSEWVETCNDAGTAWVRPGMGCMGMCVDGSCGMPDTTAY